MESEWKGKIYGFVKLVCVKMEKEKKKPCIGKLRESNYNDGKKGKYIETRKKNKNNKFKKQMKLSL